MTASTATRRTSGRSKAARRAPRFTAATADRYELYQLAVQAPAQDARFLTRVFRAERGRAPLLLREDFCGTAYLCSHWVQRSPEHRAEGFDIDPEPIAWGMAHNFAPLGELAARATLHLKDVREPSHQKPDVRVAFNFSYNAFKERATMLAYFRAVRADLGADGIFALDVHGGPESIEDLEESTRIEQGFTYVWEQASYAPVDGTCKRHISFRFRDGTEMRRAFRYDWRMWTMPELRDLLHEAGFTRVEAYFEGPSEDGESGNGIFRRTSKGENCDSWVSYLIAFA